MSDFTSTPSYIDSREVIERIEELTALCEAAQDPDAGQDDRDAFTADEAEELQALEEFADGADSVSDWIYGATFIRDDEFTDYTRETLIDIGTLPADIPGWIVIDWDETADNLKEDYTDFTFRGETYWARA